MMATYLAHWAYYFSLEDDLIQACRYVDICEENFDTHSVHFVRLLLAAGSEVDVVAKAICLQLDPRSGCKNIDQYREAIVPAYPAIPDMVLEVPPAIQVQPWREWGSPPPAKNPDWWRSYNNVKHQRHGHYREANLKNAIAAIAALYCLIRHLNEDQGLPKPNRYLRVRAQGSL